MKINKMYISSYIIAFLRVFISFIVLVLIGQFSASWFTGYQIRFTPLIIYYALGFSTIYSFAFVIKTRTILIKKTKP